VPSHWGSSVAEGVGFALTGWAQIVIAVMLLASPSRLLLRVAMLVNVLAIGAWMISRTWGLPFGEDRGHPHDAQFIDLVCVGIEIALVVLAAVWLEHPDFGRSWRSARLAAFAIVPIAVLALATAALASPSARNHAHDSHGGHAHDDTVAAAAPLLAKALPFIGHFQIRNRGTVGGSIAHADPASELPAVAVALDAELEAARGNTTRRIPAAEFFDGTWTTTLEADEVLTTLRVPVWDGRCGFVVDEIARRSGDFALAGVACAVQLDDTGAIRRSAIGLFGMGPTPIRAREAEAGLIGTMPSADDLEAAGRTAAGECDPSDDVHASAEYRAHVGAHLVKRALDRALGEARSG